MWSCVWLYVFVRTVTHEIITLHLCAVTFWHIPPVLMLVTVIKGQYSELLTTVPTHPPLILQRSHSMTLQLLSSVGIACSLSQSITYMTKVWYKHLPKHWQTSQSSSTNSHASLFSFSSTYPSIVSQQITNFRARPFTTLVKMRPKTTTKCHINA